MGEGSDSDGFFNRLQLQDRWAGIYRTIKPYLPPINFITVHHAYFIFVGLIISAIFFALADREEFKTLSFVDSWFLIMSAFTGSGLNTVNLSELIVAQQAILFVMMVIGSPVLVSLFTIWFRFRIFEKRFDRIVEAERERRRRKRATGAMLGMAGAMAGLPVMSTFGAGPRTKPQSPEERAKNDAFELSKPKSPRPGDVERLQAESPKLSPTTNPNTMAMHPQVAAMHTNFQENDAASLPPSPRPAPPSGQSYRHRQPLSPLGRPATATAKNGTTEAGGETGFDFRTFVHKHKHSIGRNGQFFDLDDDQREYLGGVEYRALKLLFVIVAIYFVVLQILGAITLGAWLAVHGRAATAVNAQDPWWSGIFLAISSFNNCGLTLLDAGLTAFVDDAFVLTVVTLLSFAGNAAFPAFIRGTIFLARLFFKHIIARHGPASDEYGEWEEAFDFILKYPRRLFMLMFPSKANLAFVSFFSTVVVVNWIGLLVLGLGNSVLEAFPLAKRVGVALFQATTTPSGGFAVFSISGLWFDAQVLLLIVMYLAAYPEIIVMRNSNVYEERSLGLYSTAEAAKQDEEEDAADEAAAAGMTFIVPQLSTNSMSHASGISAKHGIATTTVKTLAQVGRRGTAFVGKQLQQRMSDFQGVGIDNAAARRRSQAAASLPVIVGIKRSKTIDFEPPPAAAAASDGSVSLVSQHLRGQLAHDVWSIALALFLITIIETSHSIFDPRTFSVFNFLFEIVSGYTNIGISVGLPDQSYSFSGGWYTGSKVVMVFMMIRGRHRGLPVALDHSVKLPGWDDVAREEQDAEIRRSLSVARASMENNGQQVLY
ncbi:hypothetical protein MCOR05_006554 [Pyricularia oryzae]|nr:hypothetical protein MCOR05_006554 [Pyricularia oryzae]